jgi:prevent-host-death family protein
MRIGSMISINVREAKANLSAILRQVEKGEEVQILRRGKPVAVLTSVPTQPVPLPEMKGFRDQITITGEPSSTTLTKLRDEARY